VSPSRAKQLFALTALCSAGALAWAGWYAFAPIPSSPALATALRVGDDERASVSSIRTLRVPAEVLAVTLRDDLFPDPPPPPQELPPPRLDLELIAIYGEGDARSAFVFSPAEGDYRELALGDEAPGGATLAAIETNTAVFHLAGRTVRLELRP